jgi:predicted lipoprotein with Yx(FWY)xxD motif
LAPEVGQGPTSSGVLEEESTFEGSPMHRRPKSARLRRRTGYATFLAAIIAAASLAAVAIAKTMTLSVAKNAKVTNMATMLTKTEAIAVNSKGRAVYSLTGDSKRHPECVTSNMCLKFWFPVTVKSAKTKPVLAKGIKGKVSLWHRLGFFQVVVGGHPLYTFRLDSKKDNATGEAIQSFGGVWHVIKATVSKKNTASSPSMNPPVMGPPAYP